MPGLVLLKYFSAVSAGLGGLALAYSLNVVINLNMVVRNAADVEAKMSSVERVVEYTDKEYCECGTLTPEAPLVIQGSRPPEGWPTAGKIVVDGLSMRYRPELPNVLHGISCDFLCPHSDDDDSSSRFSCHGSSVLTPPSCMINAK